MPTLPTKSFISAQYFLYFGVMGVFLPYFNLYCHHLGFSGSQIGILSSARSVSVLHELMKYADLEPARFVVAGYADTRPVASNDNSYDRAKNRRVDISIIRGEDYQESVHSFFV